MSLTTPEMSSATLNSLSCVLRCTILFILLSLQLLPPVRSDGDRGTKAVGVVSQHTFRHDSHVLLDRRAVDDDQLRLQPMNPFLSTNGIRNLQPRAAVFLAEQSGNRSSDEECRDVKKQNDSQTCAFVRGTDDCGTDEGFINYTESVYCTFGVNLLPLAIVCLLLWWLTLLAALAVAAEKFFCPSLVVIARTLHMSDNIAGVTVMAFGNGAPDIFSAIAAVSTMKKGNAGLAVGALVGAGIFVTTVVAGTISIIKPFHAMERPFLRDITFYLTGLFMTFYVLYTGSISVIQATVFIMVYIVYVIIVIVGRYIYQARKQKQQAHTITNGENIQDDPEHGDPVLRDPGINNDCCGKPTLARQQPVETTDELTPLLASDRSSKQQRTSLSEFLWAASPIDVEAWPKDKWYWKIYAVLKVPAEFVLLLTVPIVDFRAEKRCWNRHLNCLHCITSLVVTMFFISHQTMLTKLGGVFPVWALIFLIGVVLSVVVYFTSTNDTPPVYHRAFAFLGFFTAVFWIDAVATEIVNILQTIGMMFNISNTVLGLTLLAWGNSLSDLVADTSMARQGRPKIGISAAFGGTMLNLLLGIGIPFTLKTIKDGTVELDLTVIQVLLLAAMGTSLISSLIILPLIRFNLNRYYGIYLYCLYALFMILVVLVETNVIKGHL